MGVVVVLGWAVGVPRLKAVVVAVGLGVANAVDMGVSPRLVNPGLADVFKAENGVVDAMGLMGVVVCAETIKI